MAICESPTKELIPPPKIKLDRKKSPISLTQEAVDRIKTLVSQRGGATLGIRVGVKSSGCTGLAYTFEYVDLELKGDEKIEQGGVVVYIDSKALLYLFGTTLDFVETDLESGFVFKNPNSKGSCGCGESFYV
jgi:iron-sulfur cluster assembly protein